MAFLFADENVPFGLVKILRTFGHDVLTALEAGLIPLRHEVGTQIALNLIAPGTPILARFPETFPHRPNPDGDQ